MVDLKIDLPEGFLEPEVRCGYEVSAEMKKLWAVELDLYAEFARVCEARGLSYFASSGTALGAVRHRGFIPWDDDMDVMMFRESYDALCSYRDDFGEPYFFQTFETDSGYPVTHAQLRRSDTTAVTEANLGWRRSYNQGVFLDIFPLDAVPDDDRIARKQSRRIIRLRWLANRVLGHTVEWSQRKPSFRARIGHLPFKAISKILDYRSVLSLMVDEQTRFNGMPTKRVSNLTVTPESERSRRYRGDLASAVPMEFEFLQIPVPVGYDRALRVIYGDYEVPVVGASSHGGIHFDVNMPYSVWLDDYFSGRSASVSGVVGDSHGSQKGCLR